MIKGNTKKLRNSGTQEPRNSETQELGILVNKFYKN